MSWSTEVARVSTYEEPHVGRWSMGPGRCQSPVPDSPCCRTFIQCHGPIGSIGPNFCGSKKIFRWLKAPTKLMTHSPEITVDHRNSGTQQVVNPKFVPENLIEIAEVTDVTIFFNIRMLNGCLPPHRMR